MRAEAEAAPGGRTCTRSPPPARRAGDPEVEDRRLGQRHRGGGSGEPAAAEETVERWLGGPYSIPTYIVMCESGGNYGAVNPSSGAGGAYQILPSTWQLYGGKGAPQDAPKAEQDRIAAEIWADSGSAPGSAASDADRRGKYARKVARKHVAATATVAIWAGLA